MATKGGRKYTGEVISGTLPREEMVVKIAGRPGQYKFNQATRRWDYHLKSTKGEWVSGNISAEKFRAQVIDPTTTEPRHGRYVYNYEDEVHDYHLLDTDENKADFARFMGHTDDRGDKGTLEDKLKSNQKYRQDLENWMVEDEYERDEMRDEGQESDDESYTGKLASYDKEWLDNRLDEIHSAHGDRNDARLHGGATKNGITEMDHARRAQSLLSMRDGNPTINSGRARTRPYTPAAITDDERDRMGNSFKTQMNKDFNGFFETVTLPEAQLKGITDVLRFLSDHNACREQMRMWQQMLAQVTDNQMGKKMKNWPTRSPTTYRFGADVPGLDPEDVRDTLLKLSEGGMYAYAKVFVNDDRSGVKIEYTESFETPFDILKLLVSQDSVESGDWGITRHPDGDLRLLMQRHGLKTYTSHARTAKAVEELKSSFDNTAVPGFRAFGQFYILSLADHEPKRLTTTPPRPQEAQGAKPTPRV